MIDMFSKIITNPALTTISHNTATSVTAETMLKSIGRPGFILIDKDIDPDTKQYAAAKEFLYQTTCLVVYALLVVPVFKKGSFKLAKRLFKNETDFQHFNNSKHYAQYLKLTETTKHNRLQSLEKEIKGSHCVDLNGVERRRFVKDEYNETLLNELKKDKPNVFPMVKGAVELGNIAGSVFGLAILAPQVSHAFIHPALRLLGLEKKAQKPENIDLKA